MAYVSSNASRKLQGRVARVVDHHNELAQVCSDVRIGTLGILVRHRVIENRVINIEPDQKKFGSSSTAPYPTRNSSRATCVALELLNN